MGVAVGTRAAPAAGIVVGEAQSAARRRRQRRSEERCLAWPVADGASPQGCRPRRRHRLSWCHAVGDVVDWKRNDAVKHRFLTFLFFRSSSQSLCDVALGRDSADNVLEVIERELRTNDKSKSCSFIDDE
jgi:hypothetical protein